MPPRLPLDYELCDMSKEGEYFLSFDKVISNASVKHKFSFKTRHMALPRTIYVY
jgi:hypothetical protein